MPTSALREYVRTHAENRPGVYRMLDADGDPLYVGKSIRVRTRLLSYFRAPAGDKAAKLIRETGKFDVIQENIEMMADTAHTLIQTMDAGEKLDVVLVYEANIQHLNERFVAVPLKAERAVAVQNVAARKDTLYPQLTKRLMLQLVSDTSRRRFEQLGFSWVAGSE